MSHRTLREGAATVSRMRAKVAAGVMRTPRWLQAADALDTPLTVAVDHGAAKRAQSAIELPDDRYRRLFHATFGPTTARVRLLPGPAHAGHIANEFVAKVAQRERLVASLAAAPTAGLWHPADDVANAPTTVSDEEATMLARATREDLARLCADRDIAVPKEEDGSEATAEQMRFRLLAQPVLEEMAREHSLPFDFDGFVTAEQPESSRPLHNFFSMLDNFDAGGNGGSAGSGGEARK